MGNGPRWWRDSDPRDARSWEVFPRRLTGRVTGEDLDAVEVTKGIGLRPVVLVEAHLEGVVLDLSEVELTVGWSRFDDCRFAQRVRPVLNEHGIAAQGSLASGPSLYRGCTFERVRFKWLGGFTTGRSRFEGCRFVSCRWEGHFDYESDYLGCTFTGRINGCAWGGAQGAGPDAGRRNEIVGNDFSGAVITDDVGWRFGYPVGDQVWPEGFVPRLDR